MLVNWLGDPKTNPRVLQAVQAISFADRIKCPVLMVHGQNDMIAGGSVNLDVRGDQTRGQRQCQLQTVR